MCVLDAILSSKKGNIEENAKEYLRKIHPKQIVTEDPFFATLYRVKYLYTTVRGNKKEGEKVFIFNSPNPEINMELRFKIWVDKYNKENPNRKLLNVKFLESLNLGYTAIA